MTTNLPAKANSAEYVSLDQVARRAQIYELMPVELQEDLKDSVWLTLSAEIAAILIVLIVPIDFLLNGVSGDFFIFFTQDWVNSLLRICYDIFPPILVVNTINLLVTLSILAVSKLMTQPVHEPVHWLASAHAVPAGLSAVTISIMLGLLASATVVSVILWIVVIILAITAFFVVMGILFAMV